MRQADGSHLGYCTNVHPGDSWPELRAALLGPVAAVKRRVSPTAPFGLGLRLSARAAEEVAVAELRAVMADQDFYLFTVNGFPYGRFHGAAVKRQAYRPDWSQPERLAYTDRLAEIVAALQPEDVAGSVSTVPGGLRGEVSAADVVPLLVRHAAHLARLEEGTGRLVRLALEPEPGCLLETAEDAVGLFRTLFEAEVALAALLGCRRHRAGELLRRHVGLCLDLCHAAVAFEQPDGMLDRLEAAGIGIFKLQVSAGLRLVPDAAGRAAVAAFDDGVWLHQVVARRGRRLERFRDLPEALVTAGAAEEWRVHVHVPLFAEGHGPLRSTRDFAAQVLARHRLRPIARHIEVETYTWEVLPPDLRGGGVVEAVAAELAWAKEQLSHALVGGA